MKITDDYKAKYRFWAANPQVISEPLLQKIPKFSSRKFNSHAEMNLWKKSLILEIARLSPELEKCD